MKADAAHGSPEELIRPEWPAPPRVRALVTTRQFGDMASEEGKARIKRLVAGEPLWLRQVHGTTVVDAASKASRPQADAAVAREAGAACVVMAADCMPVLLADDAGSVVAAAHAGWRGLAGGVIANTVQMMQQAGDDPAGLLAYIGPGIGPTAFEVGQDVYDAFVSADAGAKDAFVAHTPGKWLADLFALARRALGRAGLTQVYGGGLCTYRDPQRFYSYRRDRVTGRMAALIWRE